MGVSLPSFWQRLNNTRMRDVVRGRIDGRLDWRRPIYEAELPREAAALVTNVARRTKLWRNEKTDVAEELVAHFQDGLNAGHSVESLIRSFGDPRQAARLIRRAKKRGRPVLWQALVWTARGLAIFLALYVGLAFYYLLGDVSPTTDYLAVLNRQAIAVPDNERVWPVYREALLKLGDPDVAPSQGPYGVRLESRPGDFDWPRLERFLVEHADSLEAFRTASKRSRLGYVVGFKVHSDDVELLGEHEVDPTNEGEAHPSLITMIFPHLTPLPQVAQLLAADAYRAISANDAGVAYENVLALLGLSRQLTEEPCLLTGMVGLRIERHAIDSIRYVLSKRPDTWTDQQLVVLAHRLGASRPDGTAWLESEKAAQLDMIQRIYSDDGHGDGVITFEGLENLGSILFNPRTTYLPRSSDLAVHNALIAAGMPIAVSLVASRREAIDKTAQLFAMAETELTAPSWDRSQFQLLDEMNRIAKSTQLSMKYSVVLTLIPATSAYRVSLVRESGMVDGALIGIALELYRRERGDWPQSLDELVPRWLPTLPIDRINGGPLGYRIIDGQPVVYSMGNDTRDDGGRLPEECEGDPWKYLPQGPMPKSREEGDWVIWSAPTERTPVTEPPNPYEE